jgi:hypothetical protein
MFLVVTLICMACAAPDFPAWLWVLVVLTGLE